MSCCWRTCVLNVDTSSEISRALRSTCLFVSSRQCDSLHSLQLALQRFLVLSKHASSLLRFARSPKAVCFALLPGESEEEHPFSMGQRWAQNAGHLCESVSLSAVCCISEKCDTRTWKRIAERMHERSSPTKTPPSRLYTPIHQWAHE